MAQIVLYVDASYSGASLAIPQGQNVPALPPPIGGQASSMTSDVQDWITLWESANYDAKHDSVWFGPPGDNRHWAVSNFTSVWRPHGNNNCNDLFHAVSFSGSPTGDVDNQIWYYADGSVGGNKGHFTFTDSGLLIKSLGLVISLRDGPAPAPKPRSVSHHAIESTIRFTPGK
jgi:hypothetical protein